MQKKTVFSYCNTSYTLNHFTTYNSLSVRKLPHTQAFLSWKFT